jgi:hypothetical protein
MMICVEEGGWGYNFAYHRAEEGSGDPLGTLPAEEAAIWASISTPYLC